MLTSVSDKIRDPAGPEIIICCGSGGVGKTTISSAIGLLGAMAGKKTIVLTIDPARRLADALGLKSFNTEIQRVPLENIRFAGETTRSTAELYAMMLDPKSTFDQLVVRYTTPEFQNIIFKNRYYQHLSRNMAGSHEYMAMEKLYEIYSKGHYDLIVLDTPPSRRALDFIEAPQRMLNILGHNFFMRMFKPYLKAGKWGIRFMHILASPVLKGVSRIIGKQALEDFSGFMQLWDEMMYEGFSQRAEAVKALLAGSKAMFLAIMTPQRMPMDEAVFLSEKLLLNKMPFGGFIINRVHFADSRADGKKIDADTLFNGTPIDPLLKEKLITAYQALRKMAADDIRSIHKLMDKAGSKIRMITVPFEEGEIVSLEDLYRLSRQLERSGSLENLA